MVVADKKKSAKSAPTTKVRVLKSSDKSAAEVKKAPRVSLFNKKPAHKTEKTPSKWTRPFRAIGGYFKGSWFELRQVHWPDRKATWSLTIAVIIFSIVLGAVIFGLDLLFTYLFKQVIL